MLGMKRTAVTFTVGLPSGAQPMIDAGVLENPHVDAAFGIHVGSNVPAGQVAVWAPRSMSNRSLLNRPFGAVGAWVLQREAIPAWRTRPDAPITVIAPAGIDGVRLDDDPARVGEQGAAAARALNRLLDSIAEDRGRG